MRIKTIEAKDLLKLSEKQALIIDVREADEWAKGHIACATLVPLATVAQEIQTICPQTDAAVYLYCQRGRRSEMAAKILLSLGYHNVTHLHGGFEAWLDAGCPCQTPIP